MRTQEDDDKDRRDYPFEPPHANIPSVPRWLLAALPIALVVAALATQAWAFGTRGRGPSPEDVERQIDKRAERMLDQLDVNDAQKGRIVAALGKAKPELRALYGERERLRLAAEKALTAERIDGNEIERVRKETMALAERGSQLLSRTLLEIGETLTPAQRRELVERLQRQGRWR